jgi:formamidopyrimidine-DNA glycosylase
MPELPEVETIVRDLNKKVLKRTFVDIWTDFPKNIKKPNPEEFKKEIRGKKIISIKRRGKNIIFILSGQKILLIHQKMTGHLLLGHWQKKGSSWVPQKKGPMSDDPRNKFLHLVFFLDDKKQLALSDLRKFAKIELWDSLEFNKSKVMNSLGPEPLDKDFTFGVFERAVEGKRGKIKQVLMDQSVIAGIGNIYSDEILWQARIHPLRQTFKIKKQELKEIYSAIKKILRKAVSVKGDSFSDYRLLDGQKGGYQKFHNVYSREGDPCKRNDGGLIERLKIGGRSAHFCPVCQK